MGIKVTDDMELLVYKWVDEAREGEGNLVDTLQAIIELHEQSKPKPEPAGYTLDVLKECFYAGFMSSGEGFNGEWGGMKSCDTAWEEYSAMQNKPQEANKSKPEPVGYLYPSEYAKAVKNESFCKMFVVPVTNMDTGEKSSMALYTVPPTREPLSEEFLMALAEECTAQFFNGVHQNATIHFARAVEKAHGIGGNHE